jgi:hypothetical protein
MVCKKRWYGSFILLAGFLLICENASGAAYFGEKDSVTIERTGCNAVSYAQIPGEDSLFLGRQFMKADGSPVTREDGCSNSPSASEAVSAHRQGLVLDRLNWAEKSFSVVKPLLITPARITSGPIQGAVLRSAYDPSVVRYRGRYWVAFECVLAKDMFGVAGTSSCIGNFDSEKQAIHLDSVYVAVSGRSSENGEIFHSASVPSLLVFNDRIFLYWSDVTVAQGKFQRIGVRGAELEEDDKGYLWVKGARGLAYSVGPRSVEVWAPDPENNQSNTAVDLKSIWVTSKNDVVALVSLGGSGCATPAGDQPGCWRMAMAKAGQPLGDHIFNKSPLLDEAMLPTNSQDYTRPVKNQTGGYSFIGAFYKPKKNGISEVRPAPSDWSKLGGGQNILFSFPDESLWPTDGSGRISEDRRSAR